MVHIQIFSGSMNPQMTEENRNHWETLIGYKKFKVSSQPTIRHFLHWCSWCCRLVHTIIDCKIQLLHIFFKTFQYTLPLSKEHVDLPPFFFSVTESDISSTSDPAFYNKAYTTHTSSPSSSFFRNSQRDINMHVFKNEYYCQSYIS